MGTLVLFRPPGYTSLHLPRPADHIILPNKRPADFLICFQGHHHSHVDYRCRLAAPRVTFQPPVILHNSHWQVRCSQARMRTDCQPAESKAAACPAWPSFWALGPTIVHCFVLTVQLQCFPARPARTGACSLPKPPYIISIKPSYVKGHNCVRLDMILQGVQTKGLSEEGA